jgi:hypothetical protein
VAGRFEHDNIPSASETADAFLDHLSRYLVSCSQYEKTVASVSVCFKYSEYWKQIMNKVKEKCFCEAVWAFYVWACDSACIYAMCVVC